MGRVLPPAKFGKANQRKPPDREYLTPDLPARAVSSADFSDLRPVTRDAIDDSIAKIAQIQNDEAPPLPNALNIASVRPGRLAWNGAARAARGSGRSGCAIARNFRLARDMSDPHPLGTQCVGVIDLFEVCCEHRTFVPDKRLE